MLPKMLTLCPITPVCQGHTYAHLLLPVSKSSVLLRKLLLFQDPEY